MTRLTFRPAAWVAGLAMLLTVAPAARAARPDLYSLTPPQRQRLAGLILQFLNPAAINAHMQINHNDPRAFFYGHHDYIGLLERFLWDNGGREFVPLPRWDPASPIPPEFWVVQRGYQPLRNVNPQRPLPQQFVGPWLQRYANMADLHRDLRRFHDGVHVAVGGAMGDPMTAPAAPIFFCWHAFLDDVFAEWAPFHPHAPGWTPRPMDHARHGCGCGANCQCGDGCCCGRPK